MKGFSFFFFYDGSLWDRRMLSWCQLRILFKKTPQFLYIVGIIFIQLVSNAISIHIHFKLANPCHIFILVAYEHCK